jgi:predicted short-subunit dehydrogenase-like oxidoreductase (DUF2520 family)
MEKKSSVPYYRIILLGSGNVATQIGHALRQNGLHIAQVYSPNARRAKILAESLKTAPVSAISKIKKNADLYILAVKDDAIPLLAKKLKLKDQLVVHTSGSVAMNVLRPASDNIGVLYPLQTFSIGRPVNWRKVPLCLEVNSKPGKVLLEKIARRVSHELVWINTEERKSLHLAAVFAANFSNHMYVIAENLLRKKKIPFSLLHPLILETAHKATDLGPAQAQTGPASRKDTKTIKKHLKMLAGDKTYRELYLSISKSIGEK